jgi:trk system potassium uptake protein TrkA
MTDSSEGASTLDRILGYASRRLGRDGEPPSSPTDKVFVIGLGRFGSAVCATLVDLGLEVMAIDIDSALVDKWVDVLPNLRVADATDGATLKQLGVRDFDATVVAIGTGIEASVLTVAALSDAGAPNIWAKAMTPEHGRILERVGAHQVVYPEIQMGERVARIVSGAVVDFFELGDGFVLAEIETPKFLTGKPLADSQLRHSYEVSVVCIKPNGGEFTYATAETVPEQGNLIVVAGAIDAVKRLTDASRKENR